MGLVEPLAALDGASDFGFRHARPVILDRDDEGRVLAPRGQNDAGARMGAGVFRKRADHFGKIVAITGKARNLRDIGLDKDAPPPRQGRDDENDVVDHRACQGGAVVRPGLGARPAEPPLDQPLHQLGGTKARSAVTLLPVEDVAHDGERRLQRMGKIGKMAPRALHHGPVGIEQGVDLLAQGPDLVIALRRQAGLLTVSNAPKVGGKAAQRRKAQRQFRNLLEAAPDAMVIIDSVGDIALVNAQAVRMFGYQREAMVGHKVEMLIPQRLRNAHAGHRDHYFTGPKVREMGAGLELSGRRKDGSEFPIEISLSPLETDDGMFATAAVRDITDRKLAERTLTEYARTLEASNVQLEQFAYVASHDLQAPLRNIVGFNELLQRKLGPSLDGDDQELFGIIDECARRMQALIDGLLELSRVNQTKLVHQPVELQQIVDNACLQLQSTLTEAGATVTTASLPKVTGDESLLTQLLQNLIGNAIKFQPAGAKPCVHISASPTTAGRQQIQVKDNGIGIDAQQLDCVFTMFRRLHTSDDYAGTGIGLSICQKIVELHGGSIWAESEPGAGTSFFFDLPTMF